MPINHKKIKKKPTSKRRRKSIRINILNVKILSYLMWPEYTNNVMRQSKYQTESNLNRN